MLAPCSKLFLSVCLCVWHIFYAAADANPSIMYDENQKFPSFDVIEIWDPSESNAIPSELLSLITKPDVYQKTQFPTVIYGKPTFINVSVYIQNIGDVSETNANYATELYITLTWHDFRLNFTNFNGTKYENGSDVAPPSNKDYFQLITSSDHEKIWIPTVFFSNSRFSEKPAVLSENAAIFILYDGSVVYQTRVMLVPSCPMDLSAFPFDSQNCPLVISLFGYYDNHVRLNWKRADRILPPPINSEETSNSTGNSQNVAKMNEEVRNRLTGFTLGDIVADEFPVSSQSNWHATCSQFRSCLRIRFPLTRKYSFYMVDTYFPSSLITALSWLSFWISTEAVPARVTLCVTTFLTLQATTGNVRNRLPAVAYVRAVDLWLFGMQTLIFMALLEFIVIHSLSGRRVDFQLPTALQPIMRLFNEKVLRKNSDNPDTKRIFYNTTKEKLSTAERAEDRKQRKLHRAKRLDWMSRVAFPSVFVIFSIIYFSKYVS